MRKIVYILLFFTLLCSCRSVKYVPVESVRLDSVIYYKIAKDTLIQRDSVFLEVRNDTVREYKYKFVYKISERVDTTYVNKIDSISVPYPVEKSLTKWQQFKLDIGGMSIGVSVLAIIMAALWLIKKYLK